MNINGLNPLRNSVLFITLIVFLLAKFSYSSHAINLFKFQQIFMGTIVEIVLIGEDYNKAEKATSMAFQEIGRIEKLMSPWIEDSDVSKINRFAGKQWVRVSPDTLFVIKKSIEISKSTNGGFDITIGPLIRLWRNAISKGSPPPKGELKRLLDLVGFKDILIDQEGKILLKKEGMSIDLGGIAKGYAVDRAFELLRRLGYRNLIVNAGGDLRVGGTKFEKPWSIGIQDPRNSEKLIAKISLSDASIATSGDYEKYFFYQGKRYHHIINPENGMPAEGCRSVSVISKEAIFSDAMATAIFVLGPEKGFRLCQDTKGMECMIIDNDGNINITPGLKEIISFIQ